MGTRLSREREHRVTKAIALPALLLIVLTGSADRNPTVLESLAPAKGGEAFLPQHYSGLVGIYEQIARDIRHQYTIGYVPLKPARRGAYHAIRVHAK